MRCGHGVSVAPNERVSVPADSTTPSSFPLSRLLVIYQSSAAAAAAVVITTGPICMRTSALRGPASVYRNDVVRNESVDWNSSTVQRSSFVNFRFPRLDEFPRRNRFLPISSSFPSGRITRQFSSAGKAR